MQKKRQKYELLKKKDNEVNLTQILNNNTCNSSTRYLHVWMDETQYNYKRYNFKFKKAKK